MARKIQDIDSYIKTFSGDVQAILRKVRLAIRQAAPEAEESISYMMPAFKLNDFPLVYFAAWNSHLSLYPTGTTMIDDIPGVQKYRAAKGTLKFTFDKPVPYALIKKIVKFRIRETAGSAKMSDFPDKLSAPALRALDSAKVKSLAQLAKRTEKEIADLHGMGPSGIRLVKAAMRKKRLSFVNGKQ